LSAFGCFLLAAAAISAAVLGFSNGFAGPAPLGLALAGGAIAAGVALWRPPRERQAPYPPVKRNSDTP
jgi:hypothetical protein